MEPVFAFDLVLPARGQGALTQSLHQQLRAAILDGRLQVERQNVYHLSRNAGRR